MHAIERRQHGVTIIEVVGRLRVEDGVDDFRALVAGLIADGRRHVVLNLARCLYVDTAGLGEVATALVRAQKAGGRLVLVSPTARVQELLRITRLLDLFTVCGDEPSAIDAVHRS